MNTENVVIDLKLEGSQQSSSALSGFTGVLLKTVAAHAALATGMGALRARGVDLDKMFEGLGARLAGAGRTLQTGVATGAHAAGGALRTVGTAAAFATPFVVALGAGVLAVGGALATVKIAQEMREMAQEGARLAPVSQAFDNLAVTVGRAGGSLRNELRAATRGTVTDVQLMKASVVALNSEAIKSPEVLTELANSAFVLGRTVGLDTTEAFNNMIRGIGLMNPALLKSVGVLVSAEEAHRKYAASIGVSVGQLTDEQKHEAFLHEVLDKVRAARDRATASTDRETQAVLRLGTAIQQQDAAQEGIRNELSAAVARSRNVQAGIEGMSSAWVVLSNAVRENRGEITDWLDRGIDAVQVVFAPISSQLSLIAAAARDAAGGLDEMAEARERLERAAGESGRFGAAGAGTEDTLAALGIRLPTRAEGARPTVLAPLAGFSTGADQLVQKLASAREQLEGLEFGAELLNAVIGDQTATDAQIEQWRRIQDQIAAAADQVRALGTAVLELPRPNLAEPGAPGITVPGQFNRIRDLGRDQSSPLPLNTGFKSIEQKLRDRDELNAALAGPAILGDAAGDGAERLQKAAAVTTAAFSAMAQIAVSGSDQAAGAIIGMVGQILSTFDGLGPAGAIVGAVGGLVSALSQRDAQPVRVVEFGPRAMDQQRELRPHVTQVIVSERNPREAAEAFRTYAARAERRDAVQRPVPVPGG